MCDSSCFYPNHVLAFDDGNTEQNNYFNWILNEIQANNLHSYHTRVCNDMSAHIIQSHENGSHLGIIQTISDTIKAKCEEPAVQFGPEYSKPEIERSFAGSMPWTEYKDNEISQGMLKVRFLNRFAALYGGDVEP
jgi:hypothetical protein